MKKNSILFLLVMCAPMHAFYFSKAEPIKLAFNNTPRMFGKTHFIIGYSPTEKEKKAQEKRPQLQSSSLPFNLESNGRISQAYFSPDDRVNKVLLHLIDQERESISVAVFAFTDGEIAQALIHAKNRGVRVEILVDRLCVTDRFGKIKLLTSNGCSVFVYDRKTKHLFPGLMHNKFAVFGRNVLDRSILWTGSFNFTKSAGLRNRENVLVLDNEQFVKKYKHQFGMLKQLSRKHR